MKTKSLSFRLLISTGLVALLVAATLLIWKSHPLTRAQPILPTTRPLAMVRPSQTSANSPTPTITETPRPTETPIGTPTPDHSPTPGPSPTPSDTPTRTPTATDTPIPTATPTIVPRSQPILVVTGVGELSEDMPTPATPIPTPVPTFEIPDETINILLLGSDAPLEEGEARTDTMIIVSVDPSGPTASMVSLPRDLYVYIPGKTMNRLNTAMPAGGVELLEQAILYNFGIPVHYYARVDFSGFHAVVDAVGGIDINVSCRLQDWRLKSPELDVNDVDNWEQFALEPGTHHMDGDLALWYARSRLSSNDFYRSRRQQQLLRAMLNQGVDLGLVAQVPTLWNVLHENIETDLDIGRLLQLVALAPGIRENGVQHLYLVRGTEEWFVPSTGANVLLPIWEGYGAMEETFRRLFRPPALNRATHTPISVEILNGTGNPDMAVLAADNLAWYGFVPAIGEPLPQVQETTQLRYFASNFKASYNWLISWIVGLRKSDVELVSEVSDYPYNYQLILGANYNPCLDQLYAPQAFLDP